jgi:hypothetical protein
MLNPLPEPGTKVWGNDVNANYEFVPREVTFLYKDRGLVWYDSGAGKFGWYASTFFYTEKESQDECDLLNREAKGEEVRCSLLERDIYIALNKANRGPIRIF